MQDLAARYDVAAILAGHLHATYYRRDAAEGYEHIVTANLGAPGNPGQFYTALVAEADGLAPQRLRYDAAPVVLSSPRYYDAETGLGQITEPTPLRVRVIGAAHAAQVQAVEITSPARLNAQQVAPGVWEAAYDWRPLAGGAAFQLRATVRYAAGRTQTVAQLGKVAGSYPDPPPTISLTRAGATLQITVQDTAADLRSAALYVAGARVQRWPLTGQAAAQLRYPLAALPPLAALRVKVTDRFGRATYAELAAAPEPPTEPLTPTPPATEPLTPTPPPTETATPAATETLTPTPTATAGAPSAPVDAPTAPAEPPPAPPTPTETPAAPPASTTLTLQHGQAGYTGTTATYFDGSGAGYNASAALRVDALGSQRALLRFDLAALPPGVAVQAATLRLYVQGSSNANSLTVAAHRVLAPWVASQTTRSERQAGVPWLVAGLGAERDYAATPDATAVLGAAGQWVSLDITALAQSWVQDPASNYGLILLAHAATGSVGKALCSELGWAPCAAALAPQLTLTYSLES